MPSIFITAALTTVLLMKAFECSLHFGTSHIFRGLEKLKKRQDASSFQQHVSINLYCSNANNDPHHSFSFSSRIML